MVSVGRSKMTVSVEFRFSNIPRTDSHPSISLHFRRRSGTTSPFDSHSVAIGFEK